MDNPFVKCFYRFSKNDKLHDDKVHRQYYVLLMYSKSTRDVNICIFIFSIINNLEVWKKRITKRQCLQIVINFL